MNNSCILNLSMSSCSVAKTIYRDYMIDKVGNHYIKGEYISKGSYSSVFKCKKKEDQDPDSWPLAMKVLDQGFNSYSKEIIRELKLLIELKHPLFVQLETFCINNTEPIAIITKRYTNGDLEHAITHGLMNPTMIQKAMFGIASAMEYLHRNLKVHRDLKLGNIFLDEDWEIVVGDLGIARSMNPQAQVKMTLDRGTPLYMAPELNDDENAKNTVDIYSFGVLLYMLLREQNTPLYFSDDTMILDEKGKLMISSYTLTGKIKSNIRLRYDPKIPPNLFELIEKCWNENPTKRLPFFKIVEKLETPEYILGGVDLDSYENYRNRINAIEGDNQEISDLDDDF